MSGKRFDQQVARVRKICMSFPEIEERLSHGAPTWFVRGKKTMATVWDDHHGSGILGLVCAAPTGAQEAMIDEEPDRFYRPPYVGGRGWLGVRLDRPCPDAELRAILEDAYRTVAPKTLVAKLD
jgi:hypothetical protein